MPLIRLSRFDTSQPWGFKMQGGSDVGCPLTVAQVSPNSISGRSGLQNGDVIVRIGGAVVKNSTHNEARNEMIRAGNEVDIEVERHGGPCSQAPMGCSAPVAPPEYGEDNGDQVQPKTYKMLEKELPQVAQSGGRPASIFDKKRAARSEYTKTDHSGYQKAYGQQ